MGICKLVIKAYDDNSYSSEKGEFVTTINPTNLKISNKIIFLSSRMFGSLLCLYYIISISKIKAANPLRIY